MKNLIGCVLVFLLGVALTLGFLAWREQVRKRSEETVASLDLEAAREVRDEVITRLAGEPLGRAGQIVLSETELRALAITQLAEQPRGEEIARVVREVRTELEEDSLEFGVSLDIDALERSGLVEADDLERVLGVLPMLRGREVYVGFRGVPGARDGRLALANDLEISLGFLTFPLEDLADKLGFSIGALSSKLEFELDGLTVDEVRAEEGRLLLEVRPR